MPTPFEKVEAIFHEAIQLPAEDRGGFLEGACGGDAELRREVESLLEHHRRRTATLAAGIRPMAGDLLGATALDPGLMLGPYRVERKLGEGGMGAVYLATDSRLDRQVALKVISRNLARTPEARARFLREARSAASLSHANIATLYDVGETTETPWLVMEYVAGSSLRARLSEALSEAAWLRYASEIAAALGHAHARHIVHRDIKPENILITEEDHVKVIDFGLARAIHEQFAPSGTITGPDAFIGTLAYAAPELLSGGSASARSDVYSLGAVLYEMACGGAPFVGLSGHGLISAILSGSYPACASRDPRIDPRIAALIERSMARDPAMRHKDAGEVAAALASEDTGSPRPRDAAPPPILAVIDFRNISHVPDLDWLGTGIAESLSADLARFGSVRIASRSRVVQTLRRLGCSLDDAGAAVELGRELGAEWIVTGGYQQLGERIRVTATLVETATGNALASEKVDGRWVDLFDVEDRVVAAVLQGLTIHFGSGELKRILPAETRSIAAYEHYARARQATYDMRGPSLSTAIHHFEQAIALDPDYAPAYSGLGRAHVLQFIRTTNPEDVHRASACLERAIELDPELGEPYTWLANVRLRRNDPVGSFAAGKKGVELQPDVAEAHYFCGGLYYMVPEYQPGGLRAWVSHLAEAIRLEPQFHPAWLILGASAAFLGNHGAAIRLLVEAARRAAEPDTVYRFVGAETLRATAHSRAGSWEEARTGHLEALEVLRGTGHIYTTCFETLSACGLGDIDVRCDAPAAALAHYRRARRIVRESPRTAGGARLLIRADAGLATAYVLTGNRARARELLTAAASSLEGLEGQTATATIECSLAQLWLCLAAAESVLGDLAAAAACLDRARWLGWLDGVWLRTDPLLRPLEGRSEYDKFAEELAAAPAPQLPLPIGGAEASRSSSASG
jgi:eukaryotic-like serine/threonine-protein kinase